MQFKDVIGQDSVKERLVGQYRGGRGPHALMLSGPEGCGKLAMAMALGNYLLCEHPSETDSCGTCPACRQIRKYGHPDLHYSFPIIRKSETTTCDDYMQEWKQMIGQGCYFGLKEWLDTMSADNKQAKIPDAEGDNILRKLSITSYGGGYKVLILWKPERLNDSAANNLLKFLEEPTPKTVFILVTEQPQAVLPTIVSRTQQVEMPRLAQEVVADALMERNGIERSTAMQIARTTGGSYLNALRYINVDSEKRHFFDQFVALMRGAYARDVRGLQQWSDEVGTWGRERQKHFMGYCQNLLRENFVYNFHRPELNYMTEDEAAFASKFARFINERNVRGFMQAFSSVQRDVEGNVSAKTIFFDFALQTTVLIRQ